MLSRKILNRIPQRFIPQLILFTGLLALVGASAVYAVLAHPAFKPADQASPIHPDFTLLDKEGRNVMESKTALSTTQTCGQCHDVEFITSHSFHADLGLSTITAPGETGSGRPWDVSGGLFGKFDPLTNRYLSLPGDERMDLSTAEWLMVNAARIPGGGPGVVSRDGQPLEELKPDASNPEASRLDPDTGQPIPWDWAASGGVEMNCLLCHTPNPNNDARTAEIQAGGFANASAATLLGTGIVEKIDANWEYNPHAFNANGEIKREFIQIQDPTNDNCALCHGVVHTDADIPLTLDACDTSQFHTATTGQVIAAQRINESGLNLEDKASLARSWDVHAERALKCTDCHYSLNNPAQAGQPRDSDPDHLAYDPRRLEPGEYLQRPDHNFARGQSAQLSADPELSATMRRCETCHNAPKTHANWLPYAERHMQVVACETCHVPQLYAPAIEAYDWTVIQPDGKAITACRGIDGTNTVTDLVSGYKPVLMQRKNTDGSTLLAPYNLISSWYWIYEDAAGNLRPVRQADLQAVYLHENSYAPEILAVFDANGDLKLEAGELKIDNKTKEDLIAGRLEALGLNNPRIYGQVQPYSINHNVTRGEAVSRDCRQCHNDDSRLNTPISLSSYLPGEVLPEFIQDTNVTATGEISQRDGALFYEPVPQADGIYVFGHNRAVWIDILGALFFAGVVLAVGGHATLRFLAARKRPAITPKTQPVYMYDAYERFWHWLQTFAIVLLLLTGLVIHRPDIFGIFSFPTVVIIHNALAVVLVINAGLSLFWHLAGGEIRQFLPRPYGFFDNAIVQARFYINGIFKGDRHPFEKTKEKKLNPLQQVTYFGLLNVLLPLQILTGALMWGVQTWPQIAEMLGGLPFLAPFHSLVAWLLASFIVAHVYLTTTGATVFADIQAMVTGWENVEVHAESEEGLTTAGSALQESAD